MPLQHRNISGVDQPPDVITALNKVMNMVQALSAKVDENRTQIQAKLDDNNLQVSQIGIQLNGLVKQVQALSNKQDGGDKELSTSSEDVQQLSSKLDENNTHIQVIKTKLDENHTQIIHAVEAKLNENNLLVSQLGIQLNGILKQIQDLSTKQDDACSESSTSSKNMVAGKMPVVSISQSKQHHEQEIKQLVQQFTATRNWATLRTGLEAVLDKGEAYNQLRSIEYNSKSPLYRICQSGYTQLASLLLCAGLPVNMTDSDGDTMLHGAARGGHLQLVKLLLDQGADINMRGYNLWTPLIRAVYGGDLAVVECLVGAGADTTARDMYQRTALDCAVSWGHKEIIKYLKRSRH